MTIKEAVIAICSLDVPGNTVDLELINSGLNGADTYLLSMKIEASRTAINVLSALLPLTSFKEGDLTIQLDREGIIARIKWIANDNGFDDVLDTRPKVRNKSMYW